MKRNWPTAAILIAGLYAFAVIVALIVTLVNLSEGSFHGFDNLLQIPLALPWFIIFPSVGNLILDAYIAALFGFINAGIVFWFLHAYNKTAGADRRRLMLNYLRRPPGRVLLGAHVAMALYTCWAVSVPGYDVLSLFKSLSTWLLVSIVLGFRFLFAWIDPSSRTTLINQRIRWVLIVGVILITAIATLFNAPLRLRFELSRNAMNKYAISILQNSNSDRLQPIDDAPDRVGLFSVEYVERFSGGIRFLIPHAGFFNYSAGFAYHPYGIPSNSSRDAYERLSGPWFIWVENYEDD